MPSWMKSTLASLPQTLHSFPSRSGSSMRLPSYSYESPSKMHARHPKAFIVLALVLFLVSWKNIIFDSISSATRRRIPLSPVEESAILNSTLGFQDIFVLSLPEREDRRAPLLAAGNATNLTITVLDAIRDRQIPEPDRPKTWGTTDWVPKEGELGCLMSHLRTWRKMIYENITSALIMESDVDWDMRIKQTMIGIGEGVKEVVDWPFTPDDTNSTDIQPYGNKWDLMWIGHCGTSIADNNPRIYTFYDKAAPDEEHVWSFGGGPDSRLRPAGHRMVFRGKKHVCTTSYAISNKGAHKFEKRFEEANGPIDFKMWDICENDREVSCVTAWPQVISMAESRTNIMHTEGGLSFGHEVTKERVVAGRSIQVSARVNADLGLASKGPSEWKWEWRNGETKEEKEEREHLQEEEGR